MKRRQHTKKVAGKVVLDLTRLKVIFTRTTITVLPLCVDNASFNILPYQLRIVDGLSTMRKIDNTTPYRFS